MSEESNQFLEIVRQAASVELVQEGDLVIDFCYRCKLKTTMRITNVGDNRVTCKCKNCGHYSKVRREQIE